MKYLILLNFLFFSSGQLMSLSRGGALNLYFFDIFLIFTNIFLFYYILRRGKFKVNFPLITFSFFFIFSILLTLSNTYFLDILSQIQVYSYLLRFTSYFIFGYFIFTLLENNLVYLKDIKEILIINFFYLSILNLLQFTFLNNMTDLAKFGWDPHIGRLTGSFLDPNFLAFYLVLYFLVNEFFLKIKYIEYLVVFSIFLTLSRNGILVFLLLFLIINLRNIKKIGILTLFIILFTLVNSTFMARFESFSDSNDSSYLRIVSWKEGIKIFGFSGFNGVGFNNYKNSGEFFHIFSREDTVKNSSTSNDSSLIFVLVTLGFFGLFLILCLLSSFIYDGKLIYLNFLVILGLLLNSFFINSLFYPQISMFLFTILFLGKFKKDLET